MDSSNRILMGAGNPYVIAEINTSHRGDLKTALLTIEAAQKAGASAVKFQSWSPKSLFTDSYLIENHLEKRFYEKFSLSEKELRTLCGHAESISVDFSSTAYSEEEVDFLASIESIPFIKIASMDFTNTRLVGHALQTGKTVILSTGMATAEEILECADIYGFSDGKALVLLHCTSVYPTQLEDSALGNISWLKNRFPGLSIGYSDHTEGGTAATVATALGARIFEKHFSLDTNKPGFDNQMAADVGVFTQYVADIRATTVSLEAETRILGNKETTQRSAMRRSAFAAKELVSGSKLQPEDVVFKRPGLGLGHLELSSYYGRKIKNTLTTDQLITPEMFD